MGSIKFCDRELLDNLSKIDLIADFMATKLESIDSFQEGSKESIDSPLDGPQITNVEIFRAYMAAYLHNRADIHQEGLTFLIRSLAPARHGLPIEVYVFSKTVNWGEYEAIQAEIFDHYLAIVSVFDLRVFQDPTGMDFSAITK
jgi:miniconductance mechanosensitive channel